MTENIKKVTNSIGIMHRWKQFGRCWQIPKKLKIYVWFVQGNPTGNQDRYYCGKVCMKEKKWFCRWYFEIEINKYLQVHSFDPNSDMPDIPENYLNVIFAGKGRRRHLLTVTRMALNTLPTVRKDIRRVNNNGEGWNPMLVMIKSVAETGSAGWYIFLFIRAALPTF